MKHFLKTTLAVITGLLIFAVVSIIMMTAVFGSIAALSESKPIMPAEAVLTIDFTNMTLAEQTQEADPLAALQGTDIITPVGIYDAIKAIQIAAQDPAVKFIFMKPDAAMGGQAQIEELRNALIDFRSSGKAIVSYIENPTNSGYYLASASDKIYMTAYDGGMNMFHGLSSQMIFLKDALDRLGVHVQLIRHGKYKSAGEMFVRNSSSKENMQQNKAMIDSMWESWSNDIAHSRNMTPEKLNYLLDNLKLNFPSDFLEYGLVDELLSKSQLKQKLADLFVTDSYTNVKSISLADYSSIKNTLNYKALNKIAIIYAEGNIVDGNAKEQVAGDRFAAIIEKVRNDKDVKAVVLRVNSPGGSVMASEKIKAELDLLQANNIPVIASFADYAASGGYWISANADYIFANATTLTGSIGVFSIIPDFEKTLSDKLHINITPVNSNQHSDIYNMMRPLTQNELAYMQASVERIYDRFTQVVSTGRDMSVEEVDAIGQGRVWTGAEALEIGLVDQIGTIEDAIIYAAQTIEGVTSINDVQIVGYPKPLTTLDILLESFGTGEETVFGIMPKNDFGKAYARIPYEIVVR